ncbi:MAG: hypothetical protein ACYTEO_15130 [Planctomycetota bacterium]|jgi:hypothetical protein
MKCKGAFFGVLAAFLVLAMHSGSKAVNTRAIDRVRDKGVLDSGDFQIIDDFVNEAVRELVRTKDFSSIAATRSVILARRSSKTSVQAQYAEQFSKSAHKYISSSFQEAEKLTPEGRKLKVKVNLLLLMDGLEDVQLADLAIGMLKDKNTTIRYLAVHSMTNAGIIKKLNSGGAENSKLARLIVERLGGLVDRSGPEVIRLMAEFAAGVNIEEGEDLLGRIADMRMKRYADWTVKYELLDADILRLLTEKLAPGGANKPLPATSKEKPVVARRFAQLYSYVFQRYVKGRDSLNAIQKHRLASVLVETEKSCIGRLVEMPQTVIKRAIERGDYTALLQEHSRLLGEKTQAGRLGLKLKFDYGKASDGVKRIAPLVLPKQPKPKPSPPTN